jgi:hypothetical protein
MDGHVRSAPASASVFAPDPDGGSGDQGNLPREGLGTLHRNL